MARLYAQKSASLYQLSGSLAAAATDSGSQRSDGYAVLRGIFRTDVASETGSGVRVEQSSDGGTTWDIVSSSAISTACAASSFDISVVGDAVRFVYVNGAAAASAGRAYVYLLPTS